MGNLLRLTPTREAHLLGLAQPPATCLAVSLKYLIPSEMPTLHRLEAIRVHLLKPVGSDSGKTKRTLPSELPTSAQFCNFQQPNLLFRQKHNPKLKINFIEKTHTDNWSHFQSGSKIQSHLT